MNQLKISNGVLLCLLWVFPAFAGWISSGGEILRDRNNPWFVINTSQVNYCIKRSDTTFSVGDVKFKALLELALDYWKKEFQARESLYGIASQVFIETACDQNTDLQFVLGYDALTEEQRNFFKAQQSDPANFVGLAVRTNYNVETLKARGFVLIGSDSGKNRFGNAQNTPENQWQYDGLLLRVLIHELGHVFGVGHVKIAYMDEALPEALIRGRYTNQEEDVREVQKLKPFFTLPKRYTRCGGFIAEPVKHWFYGSEGCVEFIWEGNVLRLMSVVDGKDKMILSGESIPAYRRVNGSTQVSLFLNRGQKVFAKFKDKEVLLPAAAMITEELSLELFHHDGKQSLNVQITQSPAAITARGLINKVVATILESK